MARTAFNLIRRGARTGFTLIELLVVIAIIALLVGILLPGLSQARDAARSVVCLSQLRNLGQAQLIYTNEAKEHFASLWTTGLDGTKVGGGLFVGDKTPTTPCSSFDWISPVLGDAANLPANRAERYKIIMSTFGCPTSRAISAIYSASGTPADSNDYKRIAAGVGFRQSSFLQPYGFSTVNSKAPLAIRSYPGTTTPIPNNRTQFDNPFTIPLNYTPRLDKVGTSLANKIMAVDGTRYFDTDGTLDFDWMVNGFYGSFSDSTHYVESKAFSPDYNSKGKGHLKLTFRHNDSVNAAYFDGSVRRVQDRVFWEKPELFFPSGSVYSGADANSVVKKLYKAGDVLQ